MLRTFVFELKVPWKYFLRSFLWPNFDLNTLERFASFSQKTVSVLSLKNLQKNGNILFSNGRNICFLAQGSSKTIF